jgi:hypothetical protein
VRAWCLSWGQAEVTTLSVGLTQLHFAGMTKTQTVRVIGFALIVIGATLFIVARRRQRRVRDSGRARDRTGGTTYRS